MDPYLELTLSNPDGSQSIKKSEVVKTKKPSKEVTWNFETQFEITDMNLQLAFEVFGKDAEGAEQSFG